LQNPSFTQFFIALEEQVCRASRDELFKVLSKSKMKQLIIVEFKVLAL